VQEAFTLIGPAFIRTMEPFLRKRDLNFYFPMLEEEPEDYPFTTKSIPDQTKGMQSRIRIFGFSRPGYKQVIGEDISYGSSMDTNNTSFNKYIGDVATLRTGHITLIAINAEGIKTRLHMQNGIEPTD